MKNICILFTILVQTLFGVNKTGTMAAKFLSVNIGSQAVSMGGAFTAIADDASAMYWNPAGLSFNRQNAVYINHANWIADIAMDYFGLIIPLSKSQTVGFNITSVTMGEMEVTRYGNENTGETFAASDYAVGVAFAMNVTDRFSIGFNGKYIQETIANNHAKGAALDLGTLFTTPWGFRLGTSISNFGPKMKMNGDDLIVPVDIDETIDGNNESVIGNIATDAFDLPLNLRVGIANDHSWGSILSITYSIDVNSPNDNNLFVNAGIELGLFSRILSVRGGVNSLFMEDREKELAFGIGLKPPLALRKIAIDYSFETLSHLEETHQISIYYQIK